MSAHTAKELRESILLLQNEICWGATAGLGTGSMVTLCFGKKLKRAKPYKNPHLTDDVRNYEAQYCLFLKDCAWRLQTADKVMASSGSSNLKEETMLAALDELIGKKVISVELEAPSMDLRIAFAGGIRLIVFCYAETLEVMDNYTYFTDSFCHTVQTDGGIVSAPRAP